MIRRMLRVAGWLLVGLAGSAIMLALSLTFKALIGPPVMLPSGGVQVDFWDQGGAYASGTWVIEGGRTAFPLQTVSISCQRGDGCTVATAEIAAGMLNASREFMEITRWTPEVVVFTATSALCVSYSYTISRTDRRAIGTQTTGPDAPPDLCAPLQKAPLQLSLVDGFTVWRQLDHEAWTKVQPFLWAGLALVWVWVAVMLMRTFRAPANRGGRN